MKTCLLFVVLFLTLLGASVASGNTKNEGVNFVDGAEELFLRRFTVNEDFAKRNATIEVHLTSIDMLVSVRVDTVNNINSITTTYVSGKTGQNEMEPENENTKEKIVTNQPQTFTNTSLPPPKTFSKQQIIQRQRGNNSFTTNSWFEMTWNRLSNAMWLCVGIGGPQDLNSDEFARRTVTRVDLTCAADDPVNHSIFTLDLQYTEENSYPLTRRVDLMKLFGNHRPQKSQNVALDNSKVIANETTKETLSVSRSKKEMDVDMYPNIQEMESKHGREPTVVFMGNYDNEEDNNNNNNNKNNL